MSFIVYSKKDCPYCTKVKQVLELSNKDFVTYTLDENFTREEFYAEFGEGSTFPQVILEDKELNTKVNIGGCTDTVKYLRDNM